MKNLTVAAVQIACSDDVDANIAKIETHVREAARQGAKLVVLQELFEGPYFCVDMDAKHHTRARPFSGHATVAHFSKLAKELGVVLPVSFFELDGNARYNSLAMIDADGTTLGLYRKSYIPDGPGYSEKFYFSDGNTGFKVFDTAVGKWARAFAGTSGFRKRRVSWFCKGLKF